MAGIRLEMAIAMEIETERLDHMPTQMKLDIAASLAASQLELYPDPHKALEAFKKDVTQRLAVALSMKEVK
jgi:hypothetical protein